MHTRLQIGLWAMIASGLVLSEGTAANQKGKASFVQQKTATAGQKTHPHSGVMAELHQAKHLLDVALHDYHGHRAKADSEINKAIHVLEHGHHKGHKATKKDPKKQVHHAHDHNAHVTAQQQKQSDAKLKQSEKLVRAALAQLGQKQGDKHAAHAHKLLTQAVQEIEAALHVVQHYHKHAATAVVKK